jgi:arylsulfatase A-like enzyme
MPNAPSRADPGHADGLASPSAWLWLGLSLGLVSGVGELVFLGLRKVVLGHWLRLGPHTLWMVPLLQVVLGISFAAGLAGLQRRWGGRRLEIVGAALLFFLASLPFAVGQPWIDKRAALLLTAGIAAQIGRSGILWRPVAQRWSPRLFGVLSAVVILVSGGTLLVAAVRERSLIGRLGPAAGVAPNVLLLILDTVRAASMGLYGYEHDTSPNLARMAAEGVRFDWAFAPSPWTLPSHATFFTGRWPHELSADWATPLDRRDATVAEAFSRAGYATGGFAANYSYLMRESGLARGFHRWQPFPVSLAEVIASSSVGQWIATSRPLRRLVGSQEVLGRKSAHAVHGEFLGWLDDLPAGRPFFAVLNYYDAHEPYLPPIPFRDRFGQGLLPFHPNTYFAPRYVLLAPGERRSLSGEGRAAQQAAYDGAIAYLDSEIARLLGDLAQRGILDRTIVVVTSDHGEGMGEKDRFVHGTDLYSPTVRVPLLIRFPARIPLGQVVEEPVSLRDLAATLVDLADLPDSLRVFPGVSLVPWVSPVGLGSGPSPVLQSVWPWENTSQRSFGLVEGDWHYIRTHKGGEQLYRYRIDSLEVGDQSDAAGHPEVMQAMRNRLDALLAETELSERPRPTLVHRAPWPGNDALR